MMVYIEIVNHDVLQLKNFCDLINSWREPVIKDADDTWVGNIVANSGIDTYDKVKMKFGFLKPSGFMDEDAKVNNNVLSISYEANTLNIHMWMKLVETYCPFSTIEVVADGCEDDYLVTNNHFYAEECLYLDILDNWENYGEQETEPIMPKEDVKKFLQKVLKTDEENLDTLRTMLVLSEYDGDIHVKDWTYCCLTELQVAEIF